MVRSSINKGLKKPGKTGIIYPKRGSVHSSSNAARPSSNTTRPGKSTSRSIKKNPRLSNIDIPIPPGFLPCGVKKSSKVRSFVRSEQQQQQRPPRQGHRPRLCLINAHTEAATEDNVTAEELKQMPKQRRCELREKRVQQARSVLNISPETAEAMRECIGTTAPRRSPRRR